MTNNILSLKIKLNIDSKNVFLQNAKIIDELSNLYEIECDVCIKTSIDPISLLNTKASIIYQYYTKNQQVKNTYFNGIIYKIQHLKTFVNEQNDFEYFFKLNISHPLYLLKKSKNCKIYQNKSTLEIVEDVLKTNNIVDYEIKAIQGSPKEYVVQYNETDFDFISRILEQDAIGYYFLNNQDTCKMIIFDNNGNFFNVDENIVFSTNTLQKDLQLNCAFSFNSINTIETSAYTVNDYNYNTPLTSLTCSNQTQGFNCNVYEYPAKFLAIDDGKVIANNKLSCFEWQSQTFYAKSLNVNLFAGCSYTLKDHPINSYNKQYIIYKIEHEFFNNSVSENYILGTKSQNEKMFYQNSFYSLLEDKSYKPKIKTKKPKVYGLQTAFVTGEGKEVYSDEMARIKVKFHWDLDSKNDESSSLWVRVAQNLAGQNWGGLFSPRIGMEVIVNFLEGDPDRPVVTGCLYNSNFMPAYNLKETPYYCGIKSKSFQNDAGFNEIRFNDDNNNEEIFIHAQNNMNKIIENNRTATITKGDDTLTILKGNKTIEQKGDGTNFLTHIANGNKNIVLDKGDLVIDVSGNITLKASQNITLQANQDINLQANQNISASASSNYQMTSGLNTTINASTNANISAGINCEIKATNFNVNANAMINIQSSGMLSFKGALAMIKADAVAQIQAGAVAALKGAITKLG